MPKAYTSMRTLTPGSTSVAPHDVVHITILAEAYTAAQEEEFYRDCQRLVNEVFLAPSAAFQSLAPMLAVHAVHVTSNSGALPHVYANQGGGGKMYSQEHTIMQANYAKTTAFNLRREDGPLRTVAPPGRGQKEYAKARRICKAAAPGCDHVLLLARDNCFICPNIRYGGLGDAVAIFTSSPTSGALALRHELGHILADVGEEYDGGSDYSGPNFAETARLCEPGELPRQVSTYDGVRDVWPCISWKAWLPPTFKTSTVAAKSTIRSSGGSRSNTRSIGSRGTSSEWAKPPPGSMPLAAWPFVSLSVSKPSFSLPLNSVRVMPELRGTRVLISVAGIRAAAAQAESEKLPRSETPGRDVSAMKYRIGDQNNELPPVDFGVDAFGRFARFELTLGGTTLVVPPASSLDRTFYSFSMPPLRSGEPNGGGLQLRGTNGNSFHNSKDMPLSLVVSLVRPSGNQEAHSTSVGASAATLASEHVSNSYDVSNDATAGLPPPMLCHVQIHQYSTVQDAVRAAEVPKPSTASTYDGQSALKDPLPSPLVPGNEAIGAFPVFGAHGELKGYRPTQEGCLMRDMRETCFCPVCLERLWRKVLPRTGLLRSHYTVPGSLRPISLETRKEANLPTSTTGPIAVVVAPDASTATLSVRLAPLGSFSDPSSGGASSTGGGRKEDELLEVLWYRVPLVHSSSSRTRGGRGAEQSIQVGEEITIPVAFPNASRRLDVPLPSSLAANEGGSLVRCWRARARFVTSRVRSEPRVFEESTFALLVAVPTASHPLAKHEVDSRSSSDPLIWTVITSRWQALPETNVDRDLGALVGACAGVSSEAEPMERSMKQGIESHQTRWLTSAEAGLKLPSPSSSEEVASSSWSIFGPFILPAEVIAALLVLSYVLSIQRRRSYKEV